MVQRRRRTTIRRPASRRATGATAPVRRKSSIWSAIFGAGRRADARSGLNLEVENRVVRDIWAIIYITLAILTFLALRGGIGPFGQWWASSFYRLFGIGADLIPLVFLAIGVVMLTATSIRFNFTRVLGIILLISASLGIVHLAAPEDAMLTQAAEYGGITGFMASVFFRLSFDLIGAKIVLAAVFLISLLLVFGLSFRDVIQFLWGDRKSSAVARKLEDSLKDAFGKDKESKDKKGGAVSAGKVKTEPDEKEETTEFKINRPANIKLSTDFKPQKSRISDADWVPPSLDLLDKSEESVSMDEESLREKAEVIRQKLAKFGIDVTMHDVNVGPAVMQYTLKPAEGVKLKKIVSLKHDLMLALSAKSIRIEAPIPGKSLVGIEIPNDNRTIVRLKEILLSDDFAKIKSNLRIALGRDVSGHPIISDLAAMPHLLVAGQTGSGKSVGINTFLLSLIYQNSPNDLRFILVDPKRVELVSYNGIPHLLTPVINDIDKTVSALKWAVSEMTRRYIELSKVHVRNIKEYNQKVMSGFRNKDGNKIEKIPYIVIVIDEMADLMMTAGKEVEGCVMRLAQMARATGIHLVLATQRPSVNVITGVIKANIPTRLSFAVTNGHDSKTILDTVGAEDLLGQGDMLFVPPGASKPVRIQGPYVSTEEVRKVTNAIKLELGDEEPEYKTEITEKKHDDVQLPGVKSSGGSAGGSDDDMVLQALRVVVETGRASASLLQRRLSLGYARAARMIDLLEERGYVGPAAGAKPRQIFMTAEKLAELESPSTSSGQAGKTGTDEEATARENQTKLDEMERKREG